MSWLFGGARQANQDSLRDYQRKVAASARGMDREIGRMDTQEKRLQQELAKHASTEGKLELATTKAKELVRLRAHRARLYTMKGHLTGLAQQLQTVQSTTKIQETLAITAHMLQGLNSRVDAGSVMRMLAEFEKQNILMTNKQELMDDTLDSTLEVDGEQDAMTDAVLDVLQEAGLDINARLARPFSAKNMEEKAGLDGDLENRLQRLRMS
jgi:charged multivesicular body protein 2A